jgi:hypothetical protein
MHLSTITYYQMKIRNAHSSKASMDGTSYSKVEALSCTEHYSTANRHLQLRPVRLLLHMLQSEPNKPYTGVPEQGHQRSKDRTPFHFWLTRITPFH